MTPQDQTQAEDEFDTPFGRLDIDNLMDCYEASHGTSMTKDYREKVKRYIDHYANQRALELLDELKALGQEWKMPEGTVVVFLKSDLKAKRLNLTKERK